MSGIKLRVSYNDICVYDTERGEWEEMRELDRAPKKRMNHSAGLMGCLMLVSGGYNTETKTVMSDLCIFDIELTRWVDCWVYTLSERSNFVPRQMHTVTALYNSDNYSYPREMFTKP